MSSAAHHANGEPRRRRIGVRRVEALLRLYREVEAEWSGAVTDVRTSRDGAGAEDDLETIAQMLTSRMHQIVDHRKEVEQALERLADGTYGTCEDCENRIPAERLEANPAAIRCVGCQKQAEWRRAT